VTSKLRLTLRQACYCTVGWPLWKKSEPRMKPNKAEGAQSKKELTHTARITLNPIPSPQAALVPHGGQC